MTIAPPESSEPDEAAADAADVVRPVVRQRSIQKRRRERRKLVVVQAAVTAVFVVALVALAYAGWHAALRITGGNENEVTDPAAPGYVAAAKPTTVSLIAFTGDPVPVPTTVPDAATPDAAAPEPTDPAAAGPVATDPDTADPDSADPAATASSSAEPVPSLATMLLVIERSGDGGRTVVPIPSMTTLWSFEDAVPDSAENIFASGGIDVLRLRLGADMTFGTTSAATAPVAMLDDLAAQVGPVSISLPDDVLERSGQDVTVKYPAGQFTLEPGQVAEFMSFIGLDESEPNRALRQELAWEALLGAAAESGTELSLSTDGDDAASVAAVLTSAAAPETRFDLIPMESLPLFIDPPKTLYRVDQPAMPTWVAAEVPFPVSAFPGQRARVELLNGTTDPVVLRAVAPKVVGANGEISFTGNAESFDVTTSRVEYAAEEARTAAEQIAAALGLTATPNPDAASNVDVVVVVGTDQLSQG